MTIVRTFHECKALLARHAPGLPLGRARMIEGVGQFNHVLCLDERWILRFPKSPAAAVDLAGFLRALHAISPGELSLPPAPESPREEWTRVYGAIRTQLFPFMRRDAQAAASRSFADALKNDGLWRGEPCVVHGDIGAGNILFRQGRISGIIDWGFCGLGDPAQDMGALLASYGEAFAARVCRHFPALGKGLARARFYRRQYALLQALFALRDGDQAEFAGGIAAYR
ncbi:MAG: phosphotransferase [Chloroflexi bacterium]|nr:phosphotransferase [Chloroflexota bacterium]MCY4246443.1 phosphotransferase [Chloroflexota bacterium]